MENLCNKERYEHITELIKSIMKYDTYWYRSITLALLEDGFSWWKVKNNRSDGLLNEFNCALKSPSTGCFIVCMTVILLKLRALSLGFNSSKLLPNPNCDITKDIVFTC